MAKKITIKQALIEQKLALDQPGAEKLVLSRQVLLNGETVKSAGQMIELGSLLELKSKKKYFSRAGEKIDHALINFNIDVAGRTCADVGASTGGFTGVLLEKGAKVVYAIDVAKGEIAWALRNDPRVILLEKTNARDLEKLPEEIDFVSVDVSFISALKILPRVKGWLKKDGIVVALIKPQFEAPKELVEEGGVIRNKETHRLVVKNFIEGVLSIGFNISGVIRSPIEGVSGNREYLAFLTFANRHFDLEEIDNII